ncbi:hypothetical protein ACFP1L_05035 [Lactiplantibacillus nangangensis]|uniref:Uncharacterized protein n=1 Tax=Lactiplantibacillus nangangensis TaxID=2559917 RepID=A0ABW1SHR3_9LACO|nr:hypothetical protein [Lactiplantibacillus nangangensis]
MDELQAMIQDQDGVTAALMNDLGYSDGEVAVAMDKYNATH